jgi:hypothetical protein
MANRGWDYPARPVLATDPGSGSGTANGYHDPGNSNVVDGTAMNGNVAMNGPGSGSIIRQDDPPEEALELESPHNVEPKADCPQDINWEIVHKHQHGLRRGETRRYPHHNVFQFHPCFG